MNWHHLWNLLSLLQALIHRKKRRQGAASISNGIPSSAREKAQRALSLKGERILLCQATAALYGFLVNTEAAPGCITGRH